jgi:threonine 3-dehydrogenase
VATKAEVAGKRVLVVGLGPTGLCAGAAAAALGATEVVGLNTSPYRRKIAEAMGCFTRVAEKLAPADSNAFDAVLEMSGGAEGIATALEAARIAGTVIAFGIPKEKITLDWGKYLINKELTIQSVFGRKIWDTWEKTSQLLLEKKVDLAPLITHRFALADFEEAMRVMKSQECGKILLTP